MTNESSRQFTPPGASAEAVPVTLPSSEEMLQSFDFKNVTERHVFYTNVRGKVLQAQARAAATFEKFKPGIDEWRDATGQPLQNIPRRDGLQASATAAAFYKGAFTAQCNRFEDSFRDPSKKPLEVTAFTKQILHTYSIIERQLDIMNEAIQKIGASGVTETIPPKKSNLEPEVVPTLLSSAVESSLPEMPSFDMQKMRSDMVTWLSETGWEKKYIQKQIEKINEAIERHTANPDECKKQLHIIDERLKRIRNKENEQPLVTVLEIEAQADAIDTFLKNNVGNLTLSNESRDELVKTRKLLVKLHHNIQANEEPNSRESDVLTRENILRKYSNQAQSATRWSSQIISKALQPSEPSSILATGDVSEAVVVPEVPEVPEVVAEIEPTDVVTLLPTPLGEIIPEDLPNLVNESTLLSGEAVVSLPIPKKMSAIPSEQFIQTKDVPVSKLAPNIARPSRETDLAQSELRLPNNEKLVALRQAKDAYIKALAWAIKVKTFSQQGEYVQYAEGASRDVGEASDAYYALLSQVPDEMMRLVSEKYSIKKDAMVANLERDLDGKSREVEWVKNVARVLSAKFFSSTADALNQNVPLKKAFSPTLAGVSRIVDTEAIRVTIPIDPHITFSEPDSRTTSVARGPSFEDVIDNPEMHSIGDITSADMVSDIVRPLSNSFPAVVEAPVAPLTFVESSLTSENVYRFINQFPGGIEAVADAVEEWIHKTEGYMYGRGNVISRSFFTAEQLATPYQGLKMKTVREILSIQKGKIGIRPQLRELNITEAGLKIWTDTLLRFELNHPTIPIHDLPLREVVEILFATDELTRPRIA